MAKDCDKRLTKMTGEIDPSVSFAFHFTLMMQPVNTKYSPDITCMIDLDSTVELTHGRDDLGIVNQQRIKPFAPTYQRSQCPTQYINRNNKARKYVAVVYVNILHMQ
jgi:hypothetical protein